MNYEKTRAGSFVSRFIIFFVWVLHGLFFLFFLFLVVSEDQWRELSISMYGEDQPLMNSWVLEFFVGIPLLVIASVILLLSILKEKFVKEKRKRALINVVVIVFFAALAGYFQSLLLGPIDDMSLVIGG